MSQSYYLRDLMQEDWKMFHELDKKIFTDEPITEQQYIDSLTSFKKMLVVAIDKESKSFVGYFRTAIFGNDGYISRIGVHPEHRKKGIGSYLLERSIFHLKNTGSKRLFLYVSKENKDAINLYKKFGFSEEQNSYQYKFNFDNLLANPRGKCRHVEWGETQLIALRFNLNPLQIEEYFGKENLHIVVFEVLGQQLGFCRFDPNFPGAKPFILKDAQYGLDFISHLKNYITNPKFNYLIITFDSQQHLVNYFKNNGFNLKQELLIMSKLVETT